METTFYHRFNDTAFMLHIYNLTWKNLTFISGGNIISCRIYGNVTISSGPKSFTSPDSVQEVDVKAIPWVEVERRSAAPTLFPGSTFRRFFSEFGVVHFHHNAVHTAMLTSYHP